MANDNDSVDIPATLGAILLGSLCAAVFSGVISTQAVAYFMVYLDDRRQIKALAITIWILDVCHTAFIWTACWFYLITNFGNSSAIDHIRWSIALTILFTAFTTTIVHCFLAHRIYLLSKRNLFLIVPILSLAGVRLVSAAVTAGEMLNINSFSEFDDDIGWLFTLGLAVLVCTDIIITSSLVILLRKSRTHAPSSINDVVNTLIRYAFEAATLTCVGAIVSLVCWLSMQDNLIFLGVYFVISKFYAISFFATLNARRRLRQSHSLSSSARRHGFPLRVESPATFKRPDPSSQSPSSRLQPSSEGSPVQRPLEVIVQREVEEVDRGRSP
ncbi:hypothetical protein Hypma_008381 [Hypsizygus marmoreus]|uniref:DUF6534 domain-containing protein n=1 Tax=Hypsizygus marmoreus TaxID=39966 RepID=A0A369JV98_HYPMA|nr:hypothetical protein Hypma_008381 [Hypsizygus marmoreus]